MRLRGWAGLGGGYGAVYGAGRGMAGQYMSLLAYSVADRAFGLDATLVGALGRFARLWCSASSSRYLWGRQTLLPRAAVR